MQSLQLRVPNVAARPQGLAPERVLIPFSVSPASVGHRLPKPVRCGECFHRDYRLVFTPVHERGSGLPRKTARKQPATPAGNVA